MADDGIPPDRSLLDELDALQIPGPPSPLVSIMITLGGAAIGCAPVLAVRGHLIAAACALAVAVLLLIPMAVRVRSRVLFRRRLRHHLRSRATAERPADAG
jgi:hypothetical protein